MTDNNEMAISSSGGSVLQATLNNGINCNVRVILNNINVSPPPPSDVDDIMMEEDVVGDGKLVVVLFIIISYVLFLICIVLFGEGHVGCLLLPDNTPLDFNINITF